jgi:hypothetical protein
MFTRAWQKVYTLTNIPFLLYYSICVFFTYNSSNVQSPQNLLCMWRCELKKRTRYHHLQQEQSCRSCHELGCTHIVCRRGKNGRWESIRPHYQSLKQDNTVCGQSRSWRAGTFSQILQQPQQVLDQFRHFLSWDFTTTYNILHVNMYIRVWSRMELVEIWDSHDAADVKCGLLGCDIM